MDQIWDASPICNPRKSDIQTPRVKCGRSLATTRRSRTFEMVPLAACPSRAAIRTRCHCVHQLRGLIRKVCDQPNFRRRVLARDSLPACKVRITAPCAATDAARSYDGTGQQWLPYGFRVSAQKILDFFSLSIVTRIVLLTLVRNSCGQA